MRKLDTIFVLTFDILVRVVLIKLLGETSFNFLFWLMNQDYRFILLLKLFSRLTSFFFCLFVHVVGLVSKYLLVYQNFIIRRSKIFTMFTQLIKKKNWNQRHKCKYFFGYLNLKIRRLCKIHTTMKLAYHFD